MIAQTLAGISLFKAAVDGIKSAIGTANDVSDIASYIDGLFEGEKQVQQLRSKKSGVGGVADQFGVKSVAHEIIDAKLAAEQLYEVSVLVDQRFGHGTWQTILTERSKRIEAAKAARKEQIRVRKQQQEEIMEIAGYFAIGLCVVVLVFGVLFAFMSFGDIMKTGALDGN